MSCHYYAFLAVLLWSSAYVFTNIAIESLGAGPIAFLRNALAALIMAGILVYRKVPAIRLRDWPVMFVSGLTGLGLYLLLVNKGAVYIGPTTLCVVISTAPIITALFARFFFGERLTPAGWLAVCLSFGGIVVMSLWNGVLEINRGVLWTLTAAVCFAVYNILQKRLALRFTSLQITGYSFFFAAAFLLFLIPETIHRARMAPASHLAMVAYMGVFPSVLSYLAWTKAMAIAPKTSYVANYMFLTPFLSMLLDFVITRRLPDLGTVLGGILVLGGLFLFVMAGKSGEKGREAVQAPVDAE